jgi:hypothetical protein
MGINKVTLLVICIHFHRLRVFENRVLRRIFGPKRDKMIGGWRKKFYLTISEGCSDSFLSTCTVQLIIDL